jgi:SAM-dependent methyltransferase
MYNFHSNTEEYFRIQHDNCERNILPFIDEIKTVDGNVRTLEIGCGTAGVLEAFLQRGGAGAGIDLNSESIAFARTKLACFPDVILLDKDIYLVDIEKELHGRFDIIVFKDVIEHIHDQERLLKKLHSFLKPDGIVFFGFPPWQMPFGGHHQMLGNRLLSHTPWIHLLPKSLYGGLIKLVGENPAAFLEIKETGISIERFERIAKSTGFEIVKRELHFINPIYEYKFKCKKRKQARLIAAVPWLRNFLTTSVYYIIKPVKKNSL